MQFIKVRCTRYKSIAGVCTETEMIINGSGADVPLFTVDTVRAVTEAEGKIVIPTFEGKDGHPIKISTELFSHIISYEGDFGLKGALNSPELPQVKVPVCDEAILYDADTKEDFIKLTEIENRRK